MTTLQATSTAFIIINESAYLAGQTAYYSGLDLEANPNDEYSREYSEWYRGYEDARFFSSEGNYVLEF